MKSGSTGARCPTPNDIGAASRTTPRGLLACALTSDSTASPSSRMRVARSTATRPLSVSDILREVRWNSAVCSRASRRAMAFETVACDSPSSPAALAKEPTSTTFAKTAQASKSGSFVMTIPERFPFHLFYISIDRRGVS